LYRTVRVAFRFALASLMAMLLVLSGPLAHISHALSIDDERDMGQEFLFQAKQQFPFIDDPFANQYLNELGQYLLLPLETKAFFFHFYIIKDNTLNAFAAPGGHIFVFSGLIEAMTEVDELAAVICHEIGHVSARHLAKRIEQSKNIGIATMAGIIAGMLIGGPVASAVIAGSMAASMQAQLHFSREDERQADQLSYKYMKPASFDPAGMIRALQEIQKGSWLGTGKAPAYLLTHPTGPERMSNLESMLAEYSSQVLTEDAVRFKALWPAFKTIVKARSLDPHDALAAFQNEIKKDPGAFLPHLGLGIVYMEESRYDLAIEELKKALEGHSDFIPTLRTLAEAYQASGQDEKSLPVLEKVLRLDNGDRAAMYLLGLTYEGMGREDKALALFEKLSYLPPVRDDVFYHLGLVYGRENQLGLAHYNFGVYFKLMGEMHKARFHFQKAKELAKGDPALMKKIEKETKGLKDA